MTTQTRTYKGDLPGGDLTLPTRVVRFTAGEPVEFEADEIALLGDEWSGGAKRRTKGDKPEPDPAPPGDTTTTQEA